MATPLPEPHLVFEATDQRVRVRFGGQVVADSERTVRLLEGQLPPAYYFPRDDVRMDLFARTAHSTYCPFKGNASYWTLRVGDRVAEDVLWSYEQPYEEALPLADLVAFYTDRVTLEIDGEVQASQGPGWTE